jgi:nuclear transport factor 2 (NTF2) superfamily protein
MDAMTEIRPPLPPFMFETAIQKVQGETAANRDTTTCGYGMWSSGQ